jgi:hypothetical protein
MELMEWKASGFQRIITGDESWFFFCYTRGFVWGRCMMSFLKALNRTLTCKNA